MSTFQNKHNLLNAFHWENVSENTLLISLVYWELYKNDRELMPLLSMEDMIIYIEGCFTGGAGLYNNLHRDTAVVHEKDRYTSPDQLIAYCLLLYLAGRTKQLEAIWKWLKSHYLTYDNVNKKTNCRRIMQPMAVFTAAYCAGGSWAKIPLIVAMTVAIESAEKKNDSSGFQKAWLVDSVLGFQSFDTSYNWQRFIRTYYGSEQQKDHPVNYLLERLAGR